MDGDRVLIDKYNMCRIVSIGSLKIKIFDRIARTLHDARHAPRLKRNLISLGMFDSLGYLFKFENDGLRIMKWTEMVMKGVKKITSTNASYNIYYFLGR